jgi:glycosidase
VRVQTKKFKVSRNANLVAAQFERNAFRREARTREEQLIFEYLQALLRLRREHPALRGGKLWHLASDDSSCDFLRESDEEKLVPVFHPGANAKTMSLSLRGTPAEATAGITTLFGGAQVDLAGRQLKLVLPAQSLSIIALE